MIWEAATIWYTPEKYEIRMIRTDLWILFCPDGHVDTDTSMASVKMLCEEHLKEHPPELTLRGSEDRNGPRDKSCSPNVY
jgi:hypothetical protein